mmetsp:Transcript_45065/g.113504  ORF Transcript_45065/g.113504 Transcript_45065/m.113504 type:complete len:375 (+) Transcript_45065:991-2115(+)
MAFHHVPVATGIRVDGDALEHEGGGTVAERAVHDVRVASDPADVGHARVHVTFLVVEHILVSHRRIQEVAGRGVQQTFRCTSRARSVKNEERIFCFHLDRRTVGTLQVHRGTHIDITGGVPRNLCTSVAIDKHVLYGGTAENGLIHGALERQMTATANVLIGSDHEASLSVEHAAAQSLGTEAGEHHTVYGTDTSTGQHGEGSLRDHWHVDGHTVTFAHTIRKQHVGHTTDLVQQLRVGDTTNIRRFITFVDDGNLVTTSGNMTIHTVVAHVQRCTREPAHISDSHASFANASRVERTNKTQMFGGHLSPEGLWIGQRSGVHLLVAFHAGHMRRLLVRGDGLRNRVHLGGGGHGEVGVCILVHGLLLLLVILLV